ncbi:MAG: 3-hydroxyacyl-CoA dehydrogenase family protein [Actinomycetes bacterium]
MTTISTIAVIGGGYMGGGIAQVSVMAGYPCVIADATAEAAQASLVRLIDEARIFEEQGLFAPGSTAVIAQGIRAADSIEHAVADADYIVEAVPERMDIKADALGRASAAARPDAIISSNTSAMPIEKLAALVVRPERFLGVHWMNPAPFVPGVEIIPASMTRPDVVEAAEALIRSVGKSPSRVSDQAGFVANRLQYALFHEAVRMVEEGSATPTEIDEVVSNSFGFRLPFFGPFATADMAGLDVYVGAYESFHEAYGDRFAPPALLLDRVAAGDVGLKSGGGFTGMDATKLADIVRYRNRAYAALSALRAELGPVPGRRTADDGQAP